MASKRKRLAQRCANYAAFKDLEKFDSVRYTVMKSGARTMRPASNVITIRRGIVCDPLIVNRIARNLYVWQKRRSGFLPYEIFVRNVQPMSSYRGGYMVEFDFYNMSERYEYAGVVDNECWLVDRQDIGSLMGNPDVGWSTKLATDPVTGIPGYELTYKITRHSDATANRSFI